MRPVNPNPSFIGRIYGPNSNIPIKSTFARCFIVTRITKAKIFARKLRTIEILEPVGHGFCSEADLGIVIIPKPLIVFGEEIPFLVYHIQGGDTIFDYIQHENMVLFRVDDDVIYHTLSSEHRIFHRTPWFRDE
jgi:hypothetical protein